MNTKKGTRRLAMVLSIIPVAIGLPYTSNYRTEEFGFGVMILGPITVWLVYFAAMFIHKGFSDKCCANCDKTIGKLEEAHMFKEHVVCAECYKKLNENQKELAS